MPLEPSPESLLLWIAQQHQRGDRGWRQGHQGRLLHYHEQGCDWVIKCPWGKGLRGWWSRRCLRREFQAYQKMRDIAGIPRCYGLLAGDYLVLERITAQDFRTAEIADRSAWFAMLLSILEAMHARGVAHGDLKRKANLLVSTAGTPVVIDFGTAWIRREGFHPFNQRVFAFLARTDINAYIKHKYHGRYADVSAVDRQYLRYSLLERSISRWRKWRASRRQSR